MERRNMLLRVVPKLERLDDAPPMNMVPIRFNMQQPMRLRVIPPVAPPVAPPVVVPPVGPRPRNHQNDVEQLERVLVALQERYNDLLVREMREENQQAQRRNEPGRRGAIEHHGNVRQWRMIVSRRIERMEAHLAEINGHGPDIYVDTNRDAVPRRRTPVAKNLYIPPGATNNWKLWSVEDVAHWAKKFIKTPTLAPFLMKKKINGKELEDLVSNPQKWKKAGLPTCLAVELRSHLNKVMNSFYRK